MESFPNGTNNTDQQYVQDNDSDQGGEEEQIDSRSSPAKDGIDPLGGPLQKKLESIDTSAESAAS